MHDSAKATLKISNEKMNDIMNIVQALEDSNILLKGVTKAIKNEAKEQKEGFLGMLLGTLGAGLLGNMLAGKGIVRADYELKNSFLILSHHLTNFDSQKYYENKLKFNCVFSRDNLPKTINNGAYVINLDEYTNVGTYWIVLFCKKTEIVYFDSFGVELIPEEIKEFVGNKNIKANIFRV